MRYYEIVLESHLDVLDEGWVDKAAKAAKLAAAGATAAALGYAAGDITKQPGRDIQQTPASIAQQMDYANNTAYDEPAGAASTTTPVTTLRPKARPPGLVTPLAKADAIASATPPPGATRPQARPWTVGMMQVDPRLQAAADAANAPNLVDNVSKNTEIENMLIRDAKAAGMSGVELQAFLAQASHESADFSRTEEQGGDRYFKRKYDIRYNPENATSLGNIKPGDGVKYHGRGYLQITGRYNYAQAAKALDLPLVEHPELLEEPENASKASIWYWNWRVKTNVRNMYDVEAVTKKINSKLKGLEDRQARFDAYKNLKV